MFTFKQMARLTIAPLALMMGAGAHAQIIIIEPDEPPPSPEFMEVCPTPSNLTPQVCFYTGEGFTDKVYCEMGERTVNMLEFPWKDNIESIKLIDGASVKIYSEINRSGMYDLVEKSTTKLDPDFYNHLGSYRTVAPYESNESRHHNWQHCY